MAELTGSPGSHRPPEWFSEPDPRAGRDEPGLRFSCTMCGNCCSGPAGYVLVSDDEAARLSARLGLSTRDFLDRHTHTTAQGRSLNEKEGEHGLDCIFLDRERVPGKAVCGVYEDRPAQCRTWPFWPSVVRSAQSWERAQRVCPGMGSGQHHTPVQIRIQRDRFQI